MGAKKTHSAARLTAIGKELKVKFSLSEDEILLIDSIYRGRYPAEAGLLPLGSPTREDSENAVKIAEKLLQGITRKGKKVNGVNNVPSFLFRLGDYLC